MKANPSFPNRLSLPETEYPVSGKVETIPTANFSAPHWDQAEKTNGAVILKELKITDRDYYCPTHCEKYGTAKDVAVP